MLHKNLTIQHKDLTRRHNYDHKSIYMYVYLINIKIIWKTLKYTRVAFLKLAINLYAKHIYSYKQIPQIFQKF